jgi:hypothetical protein
LLREHESGAAPPEGLGGFFAFELAGTGFRGGLQQRGTELVCPVEGIVVSVGGTEWIRAAVGKVAGTVNWRRHGDSCSIEYGMEESGQ